MTLDLGKLLRDGEITRAEHDRLAVLGRRDTASLGFGLLVGFGVVAVAAAALLLLPSAQTAVALGALLMTAGLLAGSRRADWSVPANLVVVVGALLLAGGTLVLTEGSLRGWLSVTAVFAVAATLAGSGLLTAAAVLALMSAIGAGTGYGHATYALVVTRPGLTVLAGGVLALAGLLLSGRAPPTWERLALIGARTALISANLGFWVGSLWGDGAGDRSVSPLAFSIGWALVLLAAGAWAAWTDRRWVLNTVAVFGAIHVYTQWFEHLSATPLSVLAAGLLALAAATGLWRWNRRSTPPGG